MYIDFDINVKNFPEELFMPSIDCITFTTEDKYITIENQGESDFDIEDEHYSSRLKDIFIRIENAKTGEIEEDFRPLTEKDLDILHPEKADVSLISLNCNDYTFKEELKIQDLMGTIEIGNQTYSFSEISPEVKEVGEDEKYIIDNETGDIEEIERSQGEITI